jgi:Holliday junction resolvase RusA-like endonuclease
MHGVSPTPKPDEAREMLNDMVQVLQAEGRSQEDIDTRLKSIRDMLTATEGAIDDEYVATFRYAKTIQK